MNVTSYSKGFGFNKLPTLNNDVSGNKGLINTNGITVYRLKQLEQKGLSSMNKTMGQSFRLGKVYKGQSFTAFKDSKFVSLKIAEIKAIIDEKNEIIKNNNDEIARLEWCLKHPKNINKSTDTKFNNF